MVRPTIRLKTLPSTFAFAVGMSVNFAVAQPIYIPTDLGTLGGRDSWATGISNTGHVVGFSETGEYYGPQLPVTRAFVWHDGTLTDLGTLGGRLSEARAVNSAGQVVGWSEDVPGSRRAFLWLPKEAFGLSIGMNDLGTFTSSDSAAHDINERGQIVGRSFHTFLWLPEPALGFPAGLNGISGVPGCLEDNDDVGINNLGEIVGGPGVWLPNLNYGMSAGSHALFGGTCSEDMFYAWIDINDSGLIIGVYGDYVGKMIIIAQLGETVAGVGGIPPYFGREEKLALNNRGQIVGGSGLFETEGPDAPRVVDLNARTRQVPGWHFAWGSGISDDGLIAGVGSDQESVNHAFVLTPIHADLNNDGLVGADDFLGLPDCLTGPGVDPNGGCHAHDLDADDRVDLRDFQLFQWAFGSRL